MRLIVALALIAAACSAAAPRGQDPSITADGRAIDGDTVSIDIRLSGVDSFEKRQLCRSKSGCWQCGRAAQDYASRLLKYGSATIRLTGKQSYGRPIGTVEVGVQDLGETMIAAGLALPATSYLKAEPARAQRYVAAYEQAQRRQSGAHAGYFIDPAKWRQGHRLACERSARP